MDIGKYKKAMRPKKYLDGDFVVYDPTLPDPSDVQLGARDTFAIGGGVIEGNDLGTREGFYEPQLVNDPKGKYSVKFPYKQDYGNPKFRGVQYGTKKEIEQLIKDRKIAADASYKKGVGRAAEIAKEKSEADIKKTIDSFIEQGDYENFKVKPYASQLERKLPSGNIRQSAGGRVNPKTFQYIRDMLDSGDFENLSKITGRSKEELINFNEKLPARGKVDIEKRSTAAKESFPEERKLTEEEKKEAEKKIQAKRKDRLEKTTGKAKFIKGKGDFQFHHIKQIGGEVPLTESDLKVINKSMNSKLSPYNKKLNDIADAISTNITASFDALNSQREGDSLKYLKRVDELNDQAEQLVNKATKELPKEFKPLIGFNKFYARTDEYGLPLDDVVRVERIGGGIKQGEFEKPLTQYSRKEVGELQKKINQEATKLELQYNEQEANDVLSDFCDKKNLKNGSGSLACGIKEIEKNLLKEGRQALKTGVKTPRLAKLGSFMSGLFGAVDIPIELAFAAPHILRGDKDAAKKAMIIGLFGAGRDKIQRANEELGPDSATSRIYKYEKALEDFAGVYTDVVNAQKTLQREDLEKIPQKIQDSALEALQNGIVRLKEIKQIVDEGTPTVQEISESKAELRDLQATGTFNSDDFTYLGQALSDPLQYPGRLNVGLSGFTGEEGPDRTYTGEDISKPTDFVEAQADEMYPYQKKQDYLSKAVEDAYTAYTGKDILDRYADVKIEDMYKLPQAEKEYAEKGLRQLADRIGPQAALKIAEEQGLDPSVLSGLFGYGYLERQGFAKGGMSRRDFLKLLGTAFGTIGAAKAGLLKFVGKKAATDVITTPAVAGKPEWFDAVINKVIKEGTDLTEKLATKEREIIHVQQLGEQEGARVIRDLDTGEIRLEYESPTNMGEEPVTFTYKPAEQLEEGKTVPARFEANEAEPRVVNWDGDIEFDDEFVTENVDELMSDTSALKQYGTGKLDEKDLKIREIKTQKVQKINSDSSETLEYLESSDRGVMSGRSVEDYLYEAKRVGDIKDTGEPLMNPNVIIKGKPKK